jgi:glycosyltransferase involved in cell wall biosynthesis
MKIILLQDYLRNGGTERQTVLLANSFAAAGHSVTLLTFRPGGILDGSLSSNVTRQSLQPFDTRLDWFAPGLINQVVRRSPDIILCMGRMANCYGQHLVRKTRKLLPNLVVIASMRTGKRLPALFRQSLHRVHHVVTNSLAAKTTLVSDHSVPPEKVAVIYNSLVFPAHEFPPRNESLRAQQGATSSTKVLLNVAMFRPEKNQQELITLVAGLPADFDWQLWLAGDGPSRAACMSLAHQLGATSRVRFLGFQSDPSALYAAADLAVHASHSESLSNFLIEAQAHGLPVVACDAQGIAECFVPDVTGVAIPHHQPEVFRAAVLRFARPDPALRQQAREFARANFDPPRQVAAYLDLFAALARGGSLPPSLSS